MPEVADSVLPYRNNEKAIGKYTFTFKLTSQITSQPRVTVTFPSIYPTVLVSSDSCFGSVALLLKNEKAYLNGTISGNQISFDLSNVWKEIDAGILVVEVENIVNPSNVQATSSGFFYIRTWSGIDAVIDSNVAFDYIAFSPEYTMMMNTGMINDGANIAGYTTNYIISFLNDRVYTKGTWFRLIFPDGFAFKSPVECYFIDLQLDVNLLECSSEGTVLIMKNLLTDLPIQQWKIKMKNIINPKIATAASGKFIFESLREGVYTVIQNNQFIPGVKINPGSVTDVTIVGFPLIQNLFVDYEIKFLPSNNIPMMGVINIEFPADYASGGLDKSGRVISGLNQINSSEPIVGRTTGLNIFIEYFKDFNPQYIVVRGFAYNPPYGGQTQYFKVRTFKDMTRALVIDENVQAGYVKISSIDKPYFMKVDFYKIYVEGSADTDCPIDFRLFPNPGNELKQGKSVSNFGSITIQIPIWWRLRRDGRDPQVLFGDLQAASTDLLDFVVTIVTPKTQAYGNCELPISVDNLVVSPTPGRFPFRVFTFNDGSKVHYKAGYWNRYKTPIEQDTYIMDIPVTTVALVQAWSSSVESNDPDNILHIRSNIHPFLFSWSGTVTIELTHIEDSLTDKAAWPLFGGIPNIGDNSGRQILCKFLANNAHTGDKAGWNNNRDMRGMVKTRDVTTKKQGTILQVQGLRDYYEKGSYFEMFFPEIRFCTTVGRLGKVIYSYTNSEDIDYPYTVSIREETINRVVAAPSSVKTPIEVGPANVLPSHLWRCAGFHINIDLDLKFPFEVNDYVMFKREVGHYDYDIMRSSYTLEYNPTGPYYTGHGIIDTYQANVEYIIGRMTVRLDARNSFRYRIHGIFQSPFPSQQGYWKIFGWSSGRKIFSGDLKPSAGTSTAGLYSISNDRANIYINSLPSNISNWYIPKRVLVYSGYDIPEEGEIRMQFAGSPVTLYKYKTLPTKGTIYNYVRRWKANESHVDGSFDPVTNQFVVKNFDTILKRTPLRIEWDMLTGTSNIPQQNVQIMVYNNTNTPASLQDGYGYTSCSGYNLLVETIDKNIATTFEWLGHYRYQWEIYVGSRGRFAFEIEVGHNMAYNPGENNYFKFIVDESVTINGNLEGRYAEKVGATWGHHFPSINCYATANPAQKTVEIIMKLHPYLNIVSNKRYNFFIDTRDVEITEGHTFNKPGIYTINIESYVGGVPQRAGKERYEVFGTRINHFFIYSSNKVAGEKAFYMIYIDFIDTLTILDSTPTLTTFSSIIIFFETSNNGYLEDLGLGYPDQSEIPCNMILGIPYWNTVNSAIGTLYYGYSGAPAKIKVEGYKQFSRRVFRIDIPMIQNPTTAGIVPKVWVKILQTSVTGGQKIINVQYEGHYYELNNTWTRNANYPRVDITSSIASDIRFSPNILNLNRLGLINIRFKSSKVLGDKDLVIIKFPIFWPTPYNIDWKKGTGFSLLQERGYSIRNDAQNAYYIYFETSNVLPNDQIIKLEVLSSRAIVPTNNTAFTKFEMYNYLHTRLIGVTSYSNLGSFVFTADVISPVIDCLPTSPVEYTNTDYIITFNLPHNLLDKSEIRIDFPDYDFTPVLYCSSTTSSQLSGQLAGDLKNPLKYVSVVQFNGIASGSKIEIKIPLKNKISGPTRVWRVRTYYIADNGYYYVNGDSGNVNHIAACRVVANSVSTSTPWPLMYFKYYKTRTSEYGPITFIYESVNVLRKNTITDYVFIKIPLDFQLRTAEFAAMWDDQYPYLWEYKKTASFHEIKVWAPKNVDILANKRYTLNLTTLNGLNNINGWLYPAQLSTNYLASIEVFRDNVLRENGEAIIFVYNSNFLVYESKAYIMNSNTKASFRITIKLAASQSCSSGSKGKFKFKLPTVTYKNMQRISLFDDDGGTDLQSGDPINCHFLDGSTDLGSICTFYKGAQDLGTPISVEFNYQTTLTSGRYYTFVFDGFKYPLTGGDDKHVETSLELYTNNGATHVYTGIAYDTTIIESTSYGTLTAYEAPSFDSLTIGATNIGMSIKFISPVYLRKLTSYGDGWADYLIIEFPEGYEIKYNINTQAKLTSGTNYLASAFKTVEFSSGNRWLIWRPDISYIYPNSVYVLTFKNVDQAKSLPPDTKFIVHIVNNREIVRRIQYSPITGLAPPVILSTEMSIISSEMPLSNIPKNKHQRWLLTFGHQNGPIPAGGVIQIILPATLTQQDSHGYNTIDSNLVKDLATENDIFGRWDTLSNSYLITNFKNSPVTDIIKIEFYAQSQNASPGSRLSIVVKIFKDAEMKFQILEGSVQTPILANINGFSQLMFNQNPYQSPDIVRNGENTNFDFYYRINSGWSASSIITVFFPSNGVSVPANSYLECFYDDYEASSCVVTQTSPLKISIYPPHQPTLIAGQSFNIRISTRCGGVDKEGLSFATTGKFKATISDNLGNSYSVKYEVFGKNFDWTTFRVMHSNNAQTNGITMKAQVSSAVPSTAKIRFKLPRISEGGNFLVWGSLGKEEGEYVENKGMHVVPGNLIPTGPRLICKYYQDEDYNVWEITGFNAISASNSLEFIIYDVINTDVLDDYQHVDGVLEVLTSADVIINQAVLFDMFSIAKKTTSISTRSTMFSRSTRNSLSQNGVPYTFASVPISPAVDWNDQIVFEFSNSYFFTTQPGNCNSALTPGSYLNYGKYIVFTPGDKITGTLTFGFSGMTNPPGDDTNTVRILVIYSRGFLTDMTYRTEFYTRSTAIVTVDQSSNNRGAGSKYTFTIDTSANIPAQGAISIQFPNTFEVHGITYSNGLSPEAEPEIITGSFSIAKLQLKSSYSKIANGLIKITVYAKNSNSVSTNTVTINAFSDFVTKAIIFSTSISVTITGSTPLACMYHSTSPQSIAMSSTADFIISTPTLETRTYTSPSYSGYDMIDTTKTSSNQGGNGLPIYVFPNTVFPATFFLEHLTVMKTNLANRLKISGNIPMAISAALGTISIDFGNHDLLDLGTSLPSGSIIACELLVEGMRVETLGNLLFGTFLKSPRVEVQLFSDIASGSTIDLSIMRFSNPSTEREMEVRLRYFESYDGSLSKDLFYAVHTFNIQQSTVTTSLVTISFATNRAQSLNSMTFSVPASENGRDFVIFMPTMISNKISLAPTTGFNEMAKGSGFYKKTLVTSTISATNLELPLVSTGTKYIYGVSIDASTRLVTAIVEYRPNSIGYCTLTSVSVSAITKNSASGLSTYKVNWNSPGEFPRGSYLRIKIANYLSKYRIGSFRLITGTGVIQGNYVIASDDNNIYIRGYDYISTGIVEFNIQVYSIKTGTDVNGLFEVLIENEKIVSQAITGAILSSNTFFAPERFRTYIRKNKATIGNGYGYLSLIFKLTNSALSTDKLIVEPESSFGSSYS